MLNEEELLELLSEIEPEYDNLITILPILYHSPYKLSTLSKVLKQWYNQRDHTNGCPVDNFVDYYEKTLTNQWFFALTKPDYMDEKVCKKWRSKYVQNRVDESVVFNIKGEFSLDNLRTKHYECSTGYGIRVGEFLTDLKKVLVFINSDKPLFIIKEHANMEDNAYKLSYLDYKGLSTLLNSIYLSKYIKDNKELDVSALTIFNSGRNKNIFMKDFSHDEIDIFACVDQEHSVLLFEFEDNIINGLIVFKIFAVSESAQRSLGQNVRAAQRTRRMYIKITDGNIAEYKGVQEETTIEGVTIKPLARSEDDRIAYMPNAELIQDSSERFISIPINSNYLVSGAVIEQCTCMRQMVYTTNDIAYLQDIEALNKKIEALAEQSHSNDIQTFCMQDETK